MSVSVSVSGDKLSPLAENSSFEPGTDDHARVILESITDAFFSLTRDFRFSYLNDTAQRFLRRTDLIGKRIWDEFPASRGTLFQDAYERAMGGEAVDFDEYFPAPLERWYRVRAFPAADGIAVYFQDITDRRQATAEMERRRDQMELVVRSADVGVWYCPLPFDELIWDDKVKEHFHLAPDAVVTIDTFYERLHPDDRERTRTAIARSIEARTSYDIDYRTVSADGLRTKWIRAVGRAFYGPDGKPIRFDGVTTDISMRKAAELERERMIEAERVARSEAERQSRMKDEFLTTLSHELRTPLNAILGWAQLALRDASRLDPGQAKVLDVIVRNAQAQARIVDDLLDVSRMHSGKISLEMQRVALRSMLSAAVDTARPTAEAKGIRLLIEDLPPDAGDVLVLGDSSRLQQVLWNLLSNALKFTARGGQVWITPFVDGPSAGVRVRDDGEGISPDFLPHVFDRFRQADGSITRKHGGLGLGLAIVKQVVELHGGSVHAASDGPGLGATFEVRLPLVEASVTPDAPAPPASRRDLELAGKRVLVVEDDEDARSLLADLLADSGASVTAASSAAEAVALLEASRFDVLITDIGLPGESGFDLLRRARALGPERGGDLPAIAVTAYASADDHHRSVAAGFVTHVAKPIDGAELVGLVAAAAASRPRVPPT